MKKKHILHILENNTAPGDLRVWPEALAAREWGYDVTIISPRRGKVTSKYEMIEGIEIFRHPMLIEAYGKWGFLLEYVNALFWELFLSIKIFIKKPFHIIHSANPPDHVFLIALLFKIVGVKFVFDHHDITPETYVAKFGRKDIIYYILRNMEKMTFKTANLVISTNDSYKKIAIARGSKAETEVFVVRNGPKLGSVSFMKPNARLKGGFEYLIAYVGLIGQQEGIENLLNVAEYIVSTKGIRNIKFVIIGTGPHLDYLVELSKKMNLEQYIEFTGYIPYKKFYQSLATADICVNPEFRNEFTDRSTMLKIMDYMTFSKPIVQFKTIEGEVTAGGASVYIENNDVREFAEAIIALTGNKKKREKMGEIGRKRIYEQLNWDRQKIKLKKAYAHLES